MRWYLGLCTYLLAFTLQLRKTPETSAKRPSDEGAVWPVIASNGVTFLQIKSVGSHSTSGRKKEGNKERMGYEILCQSMGVWTRWDFKNYGKYKYYSPLNNAFSDFCAESTNELADLVTKRQYESKWNTPFCGVTVRSNKVLGKKCTWRQLATWWWWWW